MNRDDRDLMEQVLGAWRPRRRDGGVRAHPAWHDLLPEHRKQAHDEAERLRILEAALDPEGLSSTARAVLARIRGES